MSIKKIKMRICGALLLFVSSFANAGFIYDFVCDAEQVCGSGGQFEGMFEVRDTNVSFGDIGNIISYRFATTLYEGLAFPNGDISADGFLDVSIIEGVVDNVSGAFRVNVLNAGITIQYNQFTVYSTDFNGSTTIVGDWQLRKEVAVSAPPALAVFALGVLGLASRRFKKHS